MDSLKNILNNFFAQPPIILLEVIDFSHEHANHYIQAAVGGTHLKVFLVWDGFVGMDLIKRHRLAYQAVGNLSDIGIHALKLKTLTGLEYINSTICL